MSTVKRIGVLLFFFLLWVNKPVAQDIYPFFDANLDTEARIDSLLSVMTLDEKVNCLSTDPDIPRLGVSGTGHVEGLHGLSLGGPAGWGGDNPQPTTIFPQAIGLAETWDTSAIKQVASVEAYETRYYYQSNQSRGGLVVRAPNADLGRDPRWGRTEECYGECPWFNSQLVEQFVKGLQGPDPDYWMTASLMKHFLANSNEDGRDSSSSDFSTELFYDYYSLPFYNGIVNGGSRAFMAAYNSYNNIPMAVNPVLKDIAVNSWGQNGIICTDGGAFKMLVSSHHYFPDLYTAAASCVIAGVNQFLDNYKEGVYGALANGYIKEEDIDSVLRGVFRVMIKLGQLDADSLVEYKQIGVVDTVDPWLTDRHKQTALDVTRKSVVLLKNTDNTLPLNANKKQRIAVIGYLADTLIQDWYSGMPPYEVTIMDGIKNKAGSKVSVTFVKDIASAEALKAAKKADVVIVVAGNNPTCGARWKQCPDPGEGKEAVDRKSLKLSCEKDILNIWKANHNTILVLQSSFPYAIVDSDKDIPAIIHITHCGQETGNALADVLFGDYNPAGRLVQSWPLSVDQLPDMMDYDVTNGRTYMYLQDDPLYCFGYGLGYSDFEYSNIRVSSTNVESGEVVTVEFDITNTGDYDGDEVAQLYVQFPDSGVKRPIKELRGFARTNIPKGETKHVAIDLSVNDLAYWNAEKNKWDVEDGTVKIQIGASSSDIRLEALIEIQK